MFILSPFIAHCLSMCSPVLQSTFPSIPFHFSVHLSVCLCLNPSIFCLSVCKTVVSACLHLSLTVLLFISLFFSKILIFDSLCHYCLFLSSLSLGFCIPLFIFSFLSISVFFFSPCNFICLSTLL
jgi:hypothetical protein